MKITCDPASSEVSASYNDLVIINSSQEWREAAEDAASEASSIILDEGEFFIKTFFSLVKISSNSSKDLEAILPTEVINSSLEAEPDMVWNWCLAEQPRMGDTETFRLGGLRGAVEVPEVAC